MIEYKLVPQYSATRIISRPELTGRLKRSLESRGILVTAGSGFGKSTLLSAFAAEVEIPFVWYSLDEEDGDTHVFCRGIGEGFVRCIPASADRIRSAQQGAIQEEGSARAFTREICNACLQLLPQHLLLILDDFHHINESTDVLEIINRIVEQAPFNLHVLIASREKPKLRIVKGGLARFGPDDLRMSEDEIRNFFRECFGGRNLSPVQAGRIFRLTEGWPVGIRMIQQHLEIHPEIDLDAFPDRPALKAQNLFTSLFEDIFLHLPDGLRSFLLQTGILEVFDAETADRLLDTSDARARIAELARKNLFLIPLDDEGSGFRYHHLFRDFLLGRLLIDHPADTVRRLHCRAAEILSETGRWQDAVHHSLEGRDEAMAVAILENAFDEIIRTASAGAVLHWTGRISETSLSVSPKILFVMGWAHYYKGMWPEAITRLAAAESAARSRNDHAVYAKTAYFFMALDYHSENFAQVEARAREAEAFLGTGSPHLVQIQFLRACALMYRNRPAEAGAIWSQAEAHPHVRRDMESAIRLMIMKAAHYDLPKGRFETAEADLEKALTRLRQADFQMLYGQTLAFLGLLRLEKGEFKQAEKLLDDSLREMEEKGNTVFVTAAYILIAVIALGGGKTDKARWAIAEAENSTGGAGAPKLWKENILCVARALLAMEDGKHADFFREAGKAIRLTEEKDQCWAAYQVYCLLGPAYAAAGRPDEGLRLLHRSLDAVKVLENPYGEARVRLLLASILLDGGRRSEAEAHQRETLSLCKNHRYDFLFLEKERSHGKKVLPLSLLDESHFQYGAFLLHRGKFGAAEKILAGLDHPRDSLRLKAIRALTDLGCREAEKPLATLAQNGTPPVSGAAAAALEHIRSLPPLPLQVFCLGQFWVVQGDRPISNAEWRRKMARSIFKFFVFHSGREFTLEQLMDRFYGDREPEKAKILLHQAISSLRTTLEPGISPRRPSAYLQVSDGIYRLDLPEGSYVDALEFEKISLSAMKTLHSENRRSAIDQLEAATEIYGGDFLEEDAYEDWTAPLRNRFAEQYNRVLSLLSAEYFRTHRYDQAARYAKMLLVREPWDEQATVLLMKALLAAGDRARAAHAYQRCRSAIQTELGITPGDLLENLYQEIVQARNFTSLRTVQNKKPSY